MRLSFVFVLVICMRRYYTGIADTWRTVDPARLDAIIGRGPRFTIGCSHRRIAAGIFARVPARLQFTIRQRMPSIVVQHFPPYQGKCRRDIQSNSNPARGQAM